MTPWQWFLAHGDKLLTGVSASILALAASGTIPANAAWVAAVTGILGVLHTAFFPEPKGASPSANVGGAIAQPPGTQKQGGFARVGVLIALAATAAVAVPAVTLVSGCQSLGLAPAQSFDQKLAYAYGVYTGVQQATASAVSAGTLKPADASQVLNVCDQARALLDSARSIEATDPNGAANKLVLATTVLTQVQTYLQSRGVK